MKSLKERIEDALERSAILRAELTLRIDQNDCRKILVLLAAARRYHEANVGIAEDNYFAARDDLLNAIAALEVEP